MNLTFQHLLREATRLTHAGRLGEATAAIRRALGSQDGRSGASGNVPSCAAGMGDRSIQPPRPKAPPRVLDGCVIEPGLRTPAPSDTGTGRGTGGFISGTHTHVSLTRRYKLYIPPGHAGLCLPLVVMLHGCTQDPDDFAAGTGMNERAREQGFFVLYPAQAPAANPSRCWNWFKHTHQRRDGGEPALLAHMTRVVVDQYGLDARRVYIAGLSAGGAMAAIIAALYPEVFAAVGVHSGLPSGAASNVAEALAVMRSGSTDLGMEPKTSCFGTSRGVAAQPRASVPTIVFHGDQDRTVHPRNGEQVVAAALGGLTLPAPCVERGVSALGAHYTRSTHVGANGKALAEHWLVHGAGHAWSGGLPHGSYTDCKGPDASGEMLRFFFEQTDGLRH